MQEIKNNPTISVIIPTYNRAHLIGRAIQSVLGQTYQDFEIIVVDDGSEDDTEKVVKSFGDERIRFIRLKENSGTSAAPRNAAIKAARGEYVGFLDSDDEWLSEKLKKQIDKFSTLSSNIGVVYGGFYLISQKSGQIIGKVTPALRGRVYISMLEGCFASIITSLIRKNCFRKAGFFDEKLPSCQHWDMWIRLARHYRFDFVPDILAKYHIHRSQRSGNLNAVIKAKEQLLRKYEVELCRYPIILSKHLKRLGVLHCLNGSLPVGRHYFLASIRQNPLQKQTKFSSKNTYIHLFLSLLAPKIYRNILRKHAVVDNVDKIMLY